MVCLKRRCNLHLINTTKMKKQFLFFLLCALSFAACTQVDQSLDSTVARRTLSANVESVFTRAGMESNGAFFWHEGDKIGTLMTNGYVRPMTLANGDGGKSTGTFEISTNETIGGYAFFPYNEDSRVDANGKLTINFPAEYDYGTVIGEKENSFGFAMWGQIAQGTVAFKHLGGVFKIYVNDLPVGENMQFSLSTPGKKLTGEFTTLLNGENPVLETSDDEQNNTVVITFSNTEENATAVFYVPVPVGTYPAIDVVVKDAAGEDIAFGYWENQTVERRAQKKGTISKKEVTGGEIDGVYSPEEGVYEISNLAGLKWVAEQVNTETTTFEGETILLTADIDLKNENWAPIGYWVTFNGTFDGQDHIISNLKHHGTEADCYVGLFGYTENATIKNLTINNVDIKLVADNSWAGGHMGALVGNIDGTTVIENITVSGDVKLDGDMEKTGAGRIGAVVGGNECNATFKNVNVNANEGSFVKGNSSIGGIAGQLQGQISFESCSSNIDVTAQWFAAGGIIGLAAEHTTFTNCSTSGNISVIAGREGNNEDLYRVGGIAGSWDDNLRTALTLVDCETSCVLSGASVDGNTASPFDCGGFVGRGYSSVVGAKVIVNGVEYQYYGNGNSVSGGYQYDAEAKLATIYDAEGLSKFAEEVNGGKSFAGETVVLAADIDLAGEEWTPIGTSSNIFKGTFDGQEHTIKNLVVNGGSESYKGLFGVTHDGEIKNLVVENAKVSGRIGVGVVAGQPYTSKYTNITVKGHIEVNGMSYVGGVGGRNAYANWTNVTVEADNTSYVKADSRENGKVYRTYVGGVCGFNGEGGHKFTNITSNIDVLGSTCDVGGLFGIAHYGNKFENCVCTGNVEIYSAEEASAAQEIGGIAGVWHNESGTTVEFTNCSFTGTLKCNIEGVQFYYDGFVGKPYNATGTGKLIINDDNGQRVIEGGFEYNATAKRAKIYDVDGLKRFANKVSLDKSFAGESVVLAADIDLGGEEWKPIGMGGKHFEGIFDGQNHTIKGLKVTARNSAAQAALFCSAAGDAQFKNFTIDEAYVKYPADGKDYYAAAVVGTIYGNLKFENISVKNSTITGNNKVGAIFAHDGISNQITVNNCHVDNCYIASEDTTDGGCVGGLIGYLSTGAANKVSTISNTSVKNSTIVGINSRNRGDRANSEFIGSIKTNENLVLNIVDCVVENNNFSQTTNGTDAVTYEGAFPAQFIGGDRAEKLLGVITINGTRVMSKVAEVNGVKYATLQEAIANVTDGGVITLIDNVTFTEETRTHNTGTWYDGLYYIGDKSFTLDLGGKTISQDGSVNDYLLNFKNAGSKANTITIKNGTVDAGTAAFCALCTSAVQDNQLTINLENVTLYNNISNGSTAKIRGGAILNVKSGAKIIGKDSYLAIECANSTVNIYEGAELYMNGTTSYNGCLAGVGGGGTINVYGGYGKGVKGGFIAMTSGGTINIAGGEWIANTNGTEGNDSNWYVLTAQSNQSESGFVGGSYINVTGGTFRGGMDAWILGQGPDEEAGLNISGGNFNANPTNYIDTEYYKVASSNGIYTVVERKYIYLNAEHWLSDNARLVAYVWTDTVSAEWFNMNAVGGTKIHRFELPDKFNYGCKIIFCRMNPSSTDNNWNNKWNQTKDLQTPTNGDNMLTIPSGNWDGTNSTWSKYTPAN